MNLFRSEEHVKRWSQYYVGGEDYIMSVEDWAEVFSGPLFRNRLEPDYMVHGSEYLVEYHAAFERVGKASPILQNAIVEEMDEIHLQRYRIVGNYARYEVCQPKVEMSYFLQSRDVLSERTEAGQSGYPLCPFFLCPASDLGNAEDA